MRLIDADVTNMKLVELYNQENSPSTKAVLRAAMQVILNAPTITPPPNAPLTLEELREMDGEPVWLAGVSSINNFKGHWDICDWENGEVVSFPYCAETPCINDYGITWLAYRRRPEGGIGIC